MGPESRALEPRRITLVTDELLGYVRTGGIGTATTFLALALARAGHRVEVLYAGPDAPAAGSSEWRRSYADADVAIRPLPRSRERVEPPYFGQMRDVEAALAAARPDVVIAQDLAAPAYTALRLRQLGLAFEETLFVVYCHGPRRWITDTARKPRVLPNAHAVTVLEQASVELADAVVSPSRYLVEWMREQGWRLPPRTFVIPYFTRWAATGEPRPRPLETPQGPVRRIAFFGRLEERKGLAPFLAGVNGVDPALLRGRELEFLGRATPAWTPEKIEARVSDHARAALSRISFETELDQHEALERLARPGTIAVLPSLGETFGNAVRECLEHGIPFLASNAGAVPELVAREDRERVLFAPTAAGIATALKRALTSAEALLPARAAFDDSGSSEAWGEVLRLVPPRRPPPQERAEVDVVVLHSAARERLESCLSGLSAQTYQHFSVVVVAAPDARAGLASEILPLSPLVVSARDRSSEALREEGVAAGHAPWLLFLDAEDVPDPALLETLVSAQTASGADVVSCGLLLPGADDSPTLHFFAGEPRGLGALANGYGTVALVRRSLLTNLATPPEVEGDADWPLLAGLSVEGARVVSVPIPLVARRSSPGDVGSDPEAALRAVQRLEAALPETLRSLARVAAGLEAEAARRRTALPPRRLARLLHRFTRSRT